MHRSAPTMARVAGVLVAAGLPAARGQEGGDMKAETAKAPERVCTEGVDRHRVCEPLFECVRVVLAQRGES